MMIVREGDCKGVDREGTNRIHKRIPSLRLSSKANERNTSDAVSPRQLPEVRTASSRADSVTFGLDQIQVLSCRMRRRILGCFGMVARSC